MSESTRALCRIIAARPFITLSDEELNDYYDGIRDALDGLNGGGFEKSWRLERALREEKMARVTIAVVTLAESEDKS